VCQILVTKSTAGCAWWGTGRQSRAESSHVPLLRHDTAERISAIVEMDPRIWILGDTSGDGRGNGTEIVIEDAGASGRSGRSHKRASGD